ncbi:acyltransferase [Tychonema sp. LEGE 07203]|uniref:acyltransferase n=1 Tax=Tychonema sp. LEGE 07203 TaxID=1828671 RepID=UPI00187FB39F|nr:acyltransferase [Tychonema sp. LEGE 07203]MBE9095195.1 acyltransferase [Tychonema sp. LEGE 07203]
MQKASNRFAEFDLIRALAIVGVVIIHAGFSAFGDRQILFVAIDTLQLFCVPAFLLLSGFFLTNKTDNQHNPAEVFKKRLSRIIPPYLFWSVALYILNSWNSLPKIDLLSLLRDILTGSVKAPYYFIVVIIQCYGWWWLLVKLRVLEPRKILLLGLTIQTIFTIFFYLAVFKYISIPLPLMERWIFSWILPFSTGLFLGATYDKIQPVLERRRIPILGATILIYLASIWEFYLLGEVNSEGWFLRSFFKLSSQGYAILFVLSVLAFSKKIALPSKISGLVKILAACSFPIYLLDSTVLQYVLLVFYKFIEPVHPLLKLGFLVTGTLLACLAIIYILQKVLPKKYSQYILGI